MNEFARAERINESEEIDEYSSLQEFPDNRDDVIMRYMSDALSGSDRDWVERDVDANADALVEIQAVLMWSKPAERRISEIESIVSRLRAESCEAYLEELGFEM